MPTPPRVAPRAAVAAGVFLMLGVLLQLIAAYYALRPARELLLFAGTVCFALSFALLPDPLALLRRRAILPAALAFLAVAVWAVLRTPSSPYPAFARAEALRLLSGVLGFLCALTLRAEYSPLARRLLFIPLLWGCAQSFADFYALGSRGGMTTGFQYSAFATHEELASALLILLPCAAALVVFSRGETTDGETLLRRFAPPALFLVLFLALLTARCRSAWVGAAAAALGGGVLLCSRARPPEARRTRAAWFGAVALPVFLALLALSGFVALTDGGGALGARIVGKTDVGMVGRFPRWRAGVALLRRNPWTGRGLGSFVVLEQTQTGVGRTPAQVLKYGANHLNTAYNYYVQWAVDAGLIGLALHISFLAAYLWCAFRLLRTSSDENRPLLIAAIALLAGTTADALASPSYGLPGIFSLWSVMLGFLLSEGRPGAGASQAAP